MNDLLKAKELLLSSDYTCVLYKENDFHTSMQRGVKPIVQMYEGDTDFHNYSAADKVVGKATAFLYSLLGVKAVYAHVISKSALEVLRAENIHVEYGTLVDYIINRRGDDICPFESAVLEVNNSQEAYKVIRNKMKEMNIN